MSNVLQFVVDWFEEKPLSFSYAFYFSYAFIDVLHLNVNHVDVLDGRFDGWMVEWLDG